MQRFFSILADARRPLRGHRRQVHRRRDHGRLRRPDRPRGPRAARLLRGPADARRRRRVRGRAAPRARASTSRPGSGSTPARWSPARSARAASGDYTAIGHTVGLAQRMEALAEPGKAYLTEHTAELAGGFLELEDLGEFEIKGASQPVRVFELAGVGAGALAARPLPRARLLALRRPEPRRWRRSRRPRAGARRARAARSASSPSPASARAASATSSPSAAAAQGLEVFEAQAQAHGNSIPFMPVLQMLRAYFGIGDGDAEQIAREKIAGRALLLDPGFADELPLIFDFLGVPDPERPVPQMSAEARQRALGGLVCRLVNAPEPPQDAGARDRGPALDRRGQRRDAGASWSSSVDGHEHAGGRQLPARVRAALGATRRLPRPRAGAAGARRTPRELLRDLAGDDPSLDGLDEPIHERTEGNPFFIEEIVRELAEAGHLEGERGAYRLARPVEDAGVPATVQAILAARIDRLGPEAKQLLQVASVVGKEVGGRALGLTAGIDDGASSSRVLVRADRRRLPLRGRALPGTGPRLPPPADPRGRLRHPARRAARRHPRGGRAGDDRARARAPRRAGGADRPATWRQAARRWRRRAGRPAPPTGPAQPADRGDAALARVTRARRPSWRRTRRRRRWRSSRACCSSTTPGGWGWTTRRNGGSSPRPRRSPTRTGDLRSLALLKLATVGAPGPRPATPTTWTRGRRRSQSRSPTNRATCTCGWRCARPAPTPTSAPATSSGFERVARRSAGAGGGRSAASAPGS